MAIEVKIQNLKNIASLSFKIPHPGAYLLTGTNGSGKTSLFTCLNRLKNRNSFQKGFKSSAHAALDSFKEASIEYLIDGQSVIYTYGNERWVPTPRRGSALLDQCGFPSVFYIAADAARVQHQEKQFSPRSVRPVSDAIRNSMNQIFSTDKFSELCYINLTRGGGEKAYLIRIPPRNQRPVAYYSEKNFSLGELCALKVLLALVELNNGSLILIDELEIAMHPRAQARIFAHLERIAADKGLTVIFSTHSVSLIKSVERNKLLFLENSNGHVKCIKGCYAAYALGHITADEESAPDCVIYVEDDSAKKCFQSMLDLYRARRGIGPTLPTALVIPLGGFKQILTFIERSPQMLPAHSRVRAALDQDVETESLQDYRTRNDTAMLHLFAQTRNQVSYLPWTPEVGLVTLLSSNLHLHENNLKAIFADPRFAIPFEWGEAALRLTGSAQRDACKRDVHSLTENVCRLLGTREDQARSTLFDYLVIKTEEATPNSIIGYVGTVLYN